MNTKIIITIFAVIFLIGIVSANGTITNVSLLNPTNLNLIAGSTGSMDLTFQYPDLPQNYNNAPLVVIANITSLNSDYPVWKGDFRLFMYAKQYLLPGFFYYNTIPMTCSENNTINFKAKDKSSIQYSINNVSNGTFYCYNPNYYMLQLDSSDTLTLNLTSNIALYPGNYSLSIGLYEMEPDTAGPIISLISPVNGSLFSEDNKIIPIKLNITDMYNIDSSSVKYKIVTLGIPSDGTGLNLSYYDSGWINITYNLDTGLYESQFNMTRYGLNQSGSYWLYAEAKDVIGNEGKL